MSAKKSPKMSSISAKMTQRILLALGFLVIQCQGFDLSLTSTPVNYCNTSSRMDGCKAEVQLFVNRLNSEQTLLPYEYNYFDICPAAGNPVAENLGQVVFGDRIRSSFYTVEFLKPTKCKPACTKKYSGDNQDSVRRLNRLKKGIRLNYQQNWYLDNLPVMQCFPIGGSEEFCKTGFPIGCYADNSKICEVNNLYGKPWTYYVFNHLDIIITYENRTKESSTNQDIGRILFVNVIPRSIKHTDPFHLDCSNNVAMTIPNSILREDEWLNITYTYSIQFKVENGTKWSSRWNHILQSSSYGYSRLFSILSSLVMVLLVIAMISALMFKISHKDANNCSKKGKDEKSKGGPKWKLLHNDVFRPPKLGMLLSVLVGSGAHVFFTVLITIVCAYLGLFHPEKRGFLTTSILVLYSCLGAPTGYISAHIYKSFGGEHWKRNALLTSMLSPGYIFYIFMLTNIIYYERWSSATTPMSALLALLALWFAVLVPFTFIGAYFAFKSKPNRNAVKINPIPRNIPKQSCLTITIPGLIYGAIPFTCIFVEQFYILDSIWSSQIYFNFGFLFLAFIMLVITSAGNSILLCYNQLSAENYKWWWRSFLTSGFTAFYIYMYCIYYFVTKLNIEDVASIFLYLAYSLIIFVLFFLLTGTIGFFACYWFVRKIYSSMDVDYESYYEKEWSPDVKLES